MFHLNDDSNHKCSERPYSFISQHQSDLFLALWLQSTRIRAIYKSLYDIKIDLSNPPRRADFKILFTNLRLPYSTKSSNLLNKSGGTRYSRVVVNPTSKLCWLPFPPDFPVPSLTVTHQNIPFHRSRSNLLA